MKVVVVGTLLTAVALASPAEAKTKRPHVAPKQPAATQPFANPFGFKVTAYSRDPEYTPPASASAATAAGGTP